MDNRDLDKNYQLLAHAIVKQAACDYRRLRERGRRGRVAKIAKFFNSSWCNLLLEGSTLTGKDILERLKSEPTEANYNIIW